MIFNRAGFVIIAILFVVFLTLACSDNTTDSRTGFAVYGRVVWRPPLTGLSLAEFRIFNDGDAVSGAEIVVGNDTIPEVSNENGLYRLGIDIDIGDTAYYAVSSTFGSAQGIVVIPDTVSIVRPARNDTLGTNSAHQAIWRSNFIADGYYAFLGRLSREAAGVFESAYDTTMEIPGLNLLDIGVDTFWVETLRGVFAREYTPNELLLPRGVVGAAGNYCEIYFRLE